jgi:hypothetical protein
MEITPTTLILVSVTCLVLGFIASLLLNTLKDDEDLPDTGVDQTPPGGRKGRYTVIARLWRERGAGKLVVEMDGRSFLTPEALDATQRERLVTSARELRAWLGMGLEGVSNPPPAAAPVTTPPPPVMRAAPASTPPAPQPYAVQTPAPAAPLRPAPVVSNARGVTPLAGKPVGKEEVVPAPKSIVMQIEDILQDMIAGTPMETRGIHLTEDPVRGVRVQVGVQFFDGIDAVADPEVKATIRKAVETWEATQ